MTETDELNRLRVAEQIREALTSILENQAEQKEKLAELRTEVAELRGQSSNIYAEVKKTNGRVTQSEKRLSALEMWRAKSAGIWAAVVVIAAVIGYLLNQVTAFFKD